MSQHVIRIMTLAPFFTDTNIFFIIVLRRASEIARTAHVKITFWPFLRGLAALRGVCEARRANPPFDHSI